MIVRIGQHVYFLFGLHYVGWSHPLLSRMSPCFGFIIYRILWYSFLILSDSTTVSQEIRKAVHVHCMSHFFVPSRKYFFCTWVAMFDAATFLVYLPKYTLTVSIWIIIIITIGTAAPFEPRPSSEASASCPYSFHHSSNFSPPTSGHLLSHHLPILILACPCVFVCVYIYMCVCVSFRIMYLVDFYLRLFMILPWYH